MSDESGGEDESRWRGDMIAYALEDGHEILVSPSFAQPDVASCSVMITREKPGPVPKEWKKDTVASALLGALAAANGEAHKIFTIRKYSKNQSVICVRFGSASSAATLVASRTVKIADELCTVSQYGEVPVRIQLSRVPLLATAEEVVNCVKHLGTIKQITRPLIQGYEDHIVSIILTPSPEVDFVEEQNKVLRQANFGGKSHIIQYRCLDEIVVCAACKEKGHFNGPKCPMVNKCLLCSEEGHQRRNCPRRHAIFPDREERDPQARLPATPAAHSARKTPAPPPPPADENALQSTGLPPLGGSTWGSFNPGISAIGTQASEDGSQKSRSPLSRDPSPEPPASRRESPSTFRSSREIVSAERRAKVNDTIRGGKERSEKLEKIAQKISERKEIKEQKRRDAKMLQCVNVQSPKELPQVDGPSDTLGAISHESVDDDTVEDAYDDCSEECQTKNHVVNYIDTDKVRDEQLNPAYLKCSDCGAEGAGIDWNTHRGNPVYQSGDIQDNICLDCPLFPTTWCTSEHTECSTFLDQIHERGLDGKICTIHACQVCGVVGLHSCTVDGQYKIPDMWRDLELQDTQPSTSKKKTEEATIELSPTIHFA